MTGFCWDLCKLQPLQFPKYTCTQWLSLYCTFLYYTEQNLLESAETLSICLQEYTVYVYTQSMATNVSLHDSLFGKQQSAADAATGPWLVVLKPAQRLCMHLLLSLSSRGQIILQAFTICSVAFSYFQMFPSKTFDVCACYAMHVIRHWDACFGASACPSQQLFSCIRPSMLSSDRSAAYSQLAKATINAYAVSALHAFSARTPAGPLSALKAARPREGTNMKYKQPHRHACACSEKKKAYPEEHEATSSKRPKHPAQILVSGPRGLAPHMMHELRFIHIARAAISSQI